MGKMKLRASSDPRRSGARATYLRATCYVTLALLPFGAAWAAEPPSAIPPQIKELEDAILSHRRAIRSGHFRVKRTYDSWEKNRHEETEITTWIDGLRVREELKEPDNDTMMCFGDRYFYHHLILKRPRVAHTALTVREIKYVDRKKEFCFHEPLMLMLHPRWYRAAVVEHSESFVGSPQRRDLRLETTNWRGQEANKVSFAMDGNRYNYWVVPSHGYSIVRMEVHWEDEQKAARTGAVEASVQHIRDGIWFPTRVEYRAYATGTLVRQEDLDIEVLSLNEPIAAAMFEPETMGIPADTLVARMPPDPGGELKWDGQRIVRMTEEDLLKRMARRPDGSGTFRRVLLLSLSLVFAAIGGAVMWWRYMRKPSDAR